MESRVPFHMFNTAVARSPVVISVPHAGRDYLAACVQLCRVPIAKLLRLEDRYADLLVKSCIASGYSTIIAQTPRLWIDLNRAEDDYVERGGGRNTGTHASTKARSGLGLVPTRLSGVGDIWRTPPDVAEIGERVSHYHRPYHAAINTALKAAHARFGVAVLLDIHSMPPLAGDDSPKIVLGDRFGRSADMAVTDAARAACTFAGYRTALNTPYAGAYILERHGQPMAGIHALQLEVCRSLYLDDTMNTPNEGVHPLQRLVLNVAAAVSESVTNRNMPLAAE